MLYLRCTLISRLKDCSKTLPTRIKRLAHIEHKVRVNDLDINIVECGRGDRSVLLMPGTLGSCWSDFKPQIEQLPDLLPNYTIIAWDPPGYGKSIPPKRQWGFDFFQNDAHCAVELMKTLARPKFSILGWSAGGITGLIAAGRFRENIKKLVIWGAGACLIGEELEGFENIRDVKKWSPAMRDPLENIYGAERLAELWTEWVDALSDIYKQRNGNFCKEEVEQITAPTFLLRGSKDPMIAGVHAQYLRERIKRIKYHEFPEGKHNIHLRYAEEFNKLVADFLLEKS